jgi:cobalamin-dependent methionine synthase I
MAVQNDLSRFTVVGENIHTTRAVSKKSPRFSVLDDGTEGIRFRDAAGNTRYLTVPESYRAAQAYQQGQIKHIMIAVQKGLSDDSAAQEEGTAYIHSEARRQIEAGAHFLDLNVDETSSVLDVQLAAMQWLVQTVQAVSPISLSIDSSKTVILREGLKAYDRRAGRPMLNSAALERLDTLDLAREYDADVIAGASGVGTIPKDTAERVANVKQLLQHAGGIPQDHIHVDPLVTPISVDSAYGRHYLDAVRAVREIYGSAIHITGGLSNVSFGMPNRKLVNEAFIVLAVEAGIDGAIIDPVQSKLADVLAQDRTAEPFMLARAMLEGEDEYCVAYLKAFRAGKLSAK